MSPFRRQSFFALITLIVDSLAVTASVYLSYALRFLTGFIAYEGDRPEFVEYASTLLVVLPVFIAFFRAYGLYQISRNIRRIEEMFIVIKAVTFSIVVLLAGTFFYRGFSYSRVYLLILWFVSIFTLVIVRYGLIQWEYKRRADRKEIVRTLVIGANRNTRQIINWAQNNPHYGREIIGVLARSPELVGKHLENIEIKGINADCEKFIMALNPDEVVLLDTNFARTRITDLVALCEDRFIDFKIGADIYGLMTRNVDVQYISTIPLLGFRSLPLDDPWNRIMKRLFDIGVSGLLILFAFPLWLLLIAMVKMSDGGPAFYSQERMGRDQKVFKVYKFRTMRVDAERQTGPVWAKPNDDRRTKTGDFLRKWNLDELPQLFNVFKGDMSLVGPRPERPHFISQFREKIPRYMARHKIKSGLTGWAQVNGYRGNTSIYERLKYDLYYMENWSLLLDIEILFMTLFAFKNAY